MGSGETHRQSTIDLAGDPPAPGALQALFGEVLGDEELRLAYRVTGGELVDPWGRAVTPGWECGRPVETIPIGSGSVEVAHRPMTAGDGNRLAVALTEGRVALEHGRMQAELQRQLVEVHRSRERLVTAIDAERRRIERDIHDGAQTRLVALGLTLRSGQRRARPDLGHAGEALVDQAVSGIQDGLSELRRFAQGVIPPVLVSDGLGGAVAELTRTIPTPVTATVDVAERPAGPVESTAWFVICEGISNALKHAPGAAIEVSIHADRGQLSVEVSDRGPGGADPGQGSGLAGLIDRVEAIGGSLQVLSSSVAGTRVRAELPCG